MHSPISQHTPNDYDPQALDTDTNGVVRRVHRLLKPIVAAVSIVVLLGAGACGGALPSGGTGDSGADAQAAQQADGQNYEQDDRQDDGGNDNAANEQEGADDARSDDDDQGDDQGNGQNDARDNVGD